MIPILVFAFMIFSFTCLSKYNLESSMSPKCFCSLTFGITVPLKKRDGWFGLLILQENNSSVVCLYGSGLYSIFH